MRFKMIEPLTLDEAVEVAALTEVPILAGGTDLLLKIKRGLIRPDTVLSLHKIVALNCLSYKAGTGLYIGSLVTHARVAQSPIVKEKFPALAQACALVGSPQIRNLGTVVGNIANASPAADTAPALLALNAEVVVRKSFGVRMVSLRDFFLGPGQTLIERGDIIEAVTVPEPLPGTSSVYLKLGRRQALEISICGVALAAQRAQDKWEEVRLALGAVGSTPLLVSEAASLLEGKEWTTEQLKQAGLSAAALSSPIDDQRASAKYRREMVEVLVERCGHALNQSTAGRSTNG